MIPLVDGGGLMWAAAASASAAATQVAGQSLRTCWAARVLETARSSSHPPPTQTCLALPAACHAVVHRTGYDYILCRRRHQSQVGGREGRREGEEGEGPFTHTLHNTPLAGQPYSTIEGSTNGALSTDRGNVSPSLTKSSNTASMSDSLFPSNPTTFTWP